MKRLITPPYADLTRTRVGAALLALVLSAPTVMAETTRDAELPVVNSVLQTIQVKGQVLDNAGVPVIGANVVVKGTTNGTITDLDGNFTLEVPQGAVLSITYVGFTEQTVTVRGSEPLTIQLKEDAEALEEVVVVGFGTQKKVNLTGSVGTVDNDKMPCKPCKEPFLVCRFQQQVERWINK